MSLASQSVMDALFKEAKQNEVQMKRNLSSTSLDESPVSIDAVFHEPMVPHKNESGESGWLVSVGEDEDVEVMPELMSAPVATLSPVAVPTARELQSQRVRELQAGMRMAEERKFGQLKGELAERLQLLEDERDWHMRRAAQIDDLISETQEALEDEHARHVESVTASLAKLVTNPEPIAEEELSVF